MVSPALNTTLLDELGRIFDWQPEPAHYFPTPATERLCENLAAALDQGERASVLTGSAGAGKTLLLQLSLQDLAGHWAHVAHLSYTAMSGSEILRSVAYAFGMPKAADGKTPSPAAWIETQLRHWTSKGECGLLVVDEAQSLPPDALAPLLALGRLQPDGRPLLQLLLVGRPALLDLLALPGLPAWAAAIGPAFSMPPFWPDESAAYIADRLARIEAPGTPVLSPSVVAEIHDRAQGRPGQINLLCKQLLQTAVLMEDEAAIDVAAVRAEADELGFHAGAAPLAAPLAASLAAPVSIAATLPTQPPPPAAQLPMTTESPPAPRKSRVLPAVVLLALAAIGAGVFLRAPAKPSAPAVVTMVPPKPPAATEELAPPADLPPDEAPASPTPEPTPVAAPAQPPPPVEPKPHRAAPTKQLAQAAPVKPSPSPSPASPQCTHLLAQLSLGEPLSAGQQHTLESTCR